MAEILSHRAGLPVESAGREQTLNWTAMIRYLEQQRPAWSPGSAQVYHALTYGWLAGELIRRVDRKNRTLEGFIREKIAVPLGIEFYVGLPVSEIRRVSPLIFDAAILRMANQSILDELNFYRGPRLYQAEVPGANGITNARSVAKFYASLITDLENGTLKRLLNDSTPPHPHPIRVAKVFGHPGKNDNEHTDLQSASRSSLEGAGGSFGFAVPSRNLSFAFVMNRFNVILDNETDPRLGAILDQVSRKINS